MIPFDFADIGFISEQGSGTGWCSSSRTQSGNGMTTGRRFGCRRPARLELARDRALCYRWRVDEGQDLTELIRRAQRGDDEAAEALLAATYRDLHRLARARLRAGGRSVLLDTTSLVNEWYLRFVASQGAEIQDRVHFIRHAANVMRSVIVDFARRHNAARRGGGAPHASLTFQVADERRAGEEQILQIHETLESLVELDRRMAEIAEMRLFAGMSAAEIAETLDVSERTVRREWEKARHWLAEALE